MPRQRVPVHYESTSPWLCKYLKLKYTNIFIGVQLFITPISEFPSDLAKHRSNTHPCI